MPHMLIHEIKFKLSSKVPQATSSNPCLPPRDTSELITLSYASQNFTRVQCYFYCLWSHFIDYFNDPVWDGAFIYTGNVPFQYSEQEGTYTDFSGNTTGNVLLATSRDHDFLLSHKGKMSNISNNSIKLTKLNFVENSINLLQMSSPIPSDPSHKPVMPQTEMHKQSF